MDRSIRKEQTLFSTLIFTFFHKRAGDDTMETSNSSSLSINTTSKANVKNTQSTQDILSRIAWLTSELVRASDEKVNLAHAAYNSVC